ncbi:CBS domain-containing protein [Neptunomonas antarctica]|uniref:CBS domain-containing protein n=1 Tax=Neptunomonas antarctica TaxID=619304 RepID=A0A1N7J820_9GAMM|nr:CBS domain-containing protein [Neptunomonas antarctica]SIS45462.1 CBS domain-containing protein [Neptunomonas antarctica]
MKSLTLYTTNPVDELVVTHEHAVISLGSSALDIFTDFKDVNPFIIDENISAIEAERLMKKSHVRLKLVVDHDKKFLGVVSLDDLNNQEIMKKLSEGYDRNDLTITDFFQPKSKLKAFDYAELCHATIFDVVEVLKNNAQQHCLVIDRTQHKIRGVISASDIARRLQIAVDITKASSFVGIYNAVHV